MIHGPITKRDISNLKNQPDGLAGLDSNGKFDGERMKDSTIGTSKLGDDITTAGKALLDDANAAAQCVTLGAEQTANKNVNGGYAGLNASGRVTKGTDVTDWLIIDVATRGLVLKSADGTYWAVQVDDLGTLNTTDLGTSKP